MTPQEYLVRHWEMLADRVRGPLGFRFILQPLVAVAIAIRVAFRDVREGRPRYFFSAIFTNPARRQELIRLAWEDIGKVFVVALVLDVVYQFIVHRWIYPAQSVIVALILAVVPYLLVRGPVTRILRRVRRARKRRR